MPPTNSPSALGPQDSQRTSSPFGSALRQLASDVPDFASTLGVAEDEIIDANVSYLRNHADIDDEDALMTHLGEREQAEANRRRSQQDLEAGDHDRPPNQERERQFQLHRAQLLQQRQDSREAWAERMNTRTSPAYGDRIPDRQSLYDWAPVSDLSAGVEADIDHLVSAIRETQPNTHPDIIRALARVEYEASRQHGASSLGRSSAQQEPSLRSAAILQSVSRNWRFSTRSRALMSRYINDRDRAISDSTMADVPTQPQRREAEDREYQAYLRHIRARPRQSNQQSQFQLSNSTDDVGTHPSTTSTTSRRTHNRSPWPAMSSSGDTPDPDAAMIEALRKRYLEDPALEVTKFEETIKFLHRHRAEDSVLENELPKSFGYSRGSASRGLMTPEAAHAMKHVGPHPSSWLIPGMTFIGQQQAQPMSEDCRHLPQPFANRHALSAAHLRVGIATTAARAGASGAGGAAGTVLGGALTATPQDIPATPAMTTTTASCAPDTWTVKVAIHSIDYESMTLKGTMEAFNVPSFPTASASARMSDRWPNSPTSNSSSTTESSASKTTFSTYLEGELIDFSKHTLLTESDRKFALKTTPDIDAAYWRKLEPFAKLCDAEIANALRDKRWIEEQLMGKYVLMRWKERMFVRPTFTSFSNRSVSQPLEQSVEGMSQPAGSNSQRGNTSYLAGSDGLGYGLSISGFYYISLRRSDGKCEGLYFDPQSSPYQRLELKPTSGGLWSAGAWEVC